MTAPRVFSLILIILSLTVGGSSYADSVSNCASMKQCCESGACDCNIKNPTEVFLDFTNAAYLKSTDRTVLSATNDGFNIPTYEGLKQSAVLFSFQKFHPPADKFYDLYSVYRL